MPATAFRQVYGRQPQGVWSAPGRVNLIGEHTDYNGGAVLPIAIGPRCRVAAGAGGDGMLRVASRQFPGPPAEVLLEGIAPGSPPGWAGYVAGVAWGLRRRHPGALPGVDLFIDGEVPAGAGLASSAALTCAAAVAMSHLAGLDLPPRELAEVARSAETEIVGAPVGLMDQMASLLCRAAHALWFDTASGATEQVAFDPGGAGLTLAVIDTKVRHAHAAGGYRRRREECDAAAARLGVPALAALRPGDLAPARVRLGDPVLWRRLRHVVTENQRVARTVDALTAADWRRVGDNFSESQESMRYDFEITCPEVDLAAAVARKVGAVGARMTGGGFGGCVIALLDAEALADLRLAELEAFAVAGYARPHVFTVAAAPGARRDRVE